MISAFNRTTVECKLASVSWSKPSILTFNRTTVECKYASSYEFSNPLNF